MTSPNFSEGGSRFYKFVFSAAQEVLLTARKWRNDLDRLGLKQVDLSQAKIELKGAVESLEIWLAPPVVNGVILDPRSNPEWRERSGVAQREIRRELVEIRGNVFSALGFSGQCAYDVVLMIGRRTLDSVEWIAQANAQHAEQALSYMVGADSVLRTETRGLGAIAQDAVDRLEAECLWEAEHAWRKSLPAETTHSKPAGRKPKATVNARMLDTMLKRPESKTWSRREWAGHLNCGNTTVSDTKAWKELAKRRAQTKAEMAIEHAKKAGRRRY